MVERGCAACEPIFDSFSGSVVRIFFNSTTIPHVLDKVPKITQNVNTLLPDLHSKLEFTLTFQHHNVRRVARHTPRGGERGRATRHRRLGGYGVFVRAGPIQSAFRTSNVCAAKSPASLWAPSRNAGPAVGGPEPQSTDSPLQHTYRATVAITTTWQRILKDAN